MNSATQPILAAFLRIAHSRLTWVLLALIAAGVASNISADEGLSPISPTSSKPSKLIILREGSRIESKRANCRVVGDHLVLVFEDARSIEALANLAAQRILQVCKDDVVDTEWIVTGKVTEFQGANYLLLEHVVRAASRLSR